MVLREIKNCVAKIDQSTVLKTDCSAHLAPHKIAVVLNNKIDAKCK